MPTGEAEANSRPNSNPKSDSSPKTDSSGKTNSSPKTDSSGKTSSKTRIKGNGEGEGTREGDGRNGRPSVVAEIREAILRGEFVPNQRLVEADLSEQFAAARASVRAALLELAKEGLVERVQNRGARVRAISLAEAVEITEVRLVVEGLCAAKAAERITEEEGEELEEIGASMRAAVSSGDVLGYSRLNEELHSRIRAISGQRTASEVLERLRAQSVRHQFKLAMHPGRPQVSLPQHLAIIEAVCAHDPDAAERAARAHLRSVIETLPEVDPAGAGRSGAGTRLPGAGTRRPGAGAGQSG